MSERADVRHAYRPGSLPAVALARSDMADAERPVFILESGRSVGSLEICDLVDAFGAQLPATRQLVAVRAGNALGTVAAYLGALAAGHVVLMLPEVADERLAGLIDRFAPNFVVGTAGESWNIVRGSSRVHELHPDLAVLLTTSGSTGSAKLVRLSHAAIVANAQSIAEYLDIRPSDRAITTLPLSYSYGLSVINSHLVAGAATILTGRSVTDPAFWELATQEGATSIAGVPYTYELLDRGEFRSSEHPSLRVMTQAGGHLPSATVERHAAWCEERGISFFVMYGQTEATARMAYMPPALLQDHPDCIGIAIPGGAFELISEDGQRVEDAEREGELLYRGPNVMMGYAESPEALAEGHDIAALATGDLAVRNAAGLYRITGRKSRFSKLFGLRVSLDTIEERLRARHPDVIAAGDDMLIAVASAASDERALRRDVDALADEMHLPRATFDALGGHDVPRLASGKPDYRGMLQHARDRRSTRDAATAPGRSVRAIYAEIFPRRAIERTDSFVSLGGDSLSYIHASIGLEQALGFLPIDWEMLPVSELDTMLVSGPGVAERRSFLDFEVVVRALAILAIVVNHCSNYIVGGGAEVLLALTGYSLARYHVQRLARGEGLSVLMTFAKRIILPYYILLIAYFTLAPGRSADLPSLLLVSNYVGRYHSLLEPYWFLEALLQAMILVVALFAIPAVRRAAVQSPWRLGIVLLLGAIAAKMLLQHAWPHGKLAERSLDAIFYLVALGWLIRAATTRDRKIMLSILLVVLAAADIAADRAIWAHVGFPANVSAALWKVIALGGIVWIPRIALPRRVRAMVAEIAGASFYVYLTHGIPVYVLMHSRLHAVLPTFLFVLVVLAVSVVTGIAFKRLMDRLIRVSAVSESGQPR